MGKFTKSKPGIALVAITTCLLLALPATAKNLADVEFGGDVVFTPLGAGGLQLTVKGPNGFALDRTFAPGEVAVFSVSEAAGDGSYRWELRGVAEKRLDRGSSDLAGLKPAAGVQSGSFSILGGQIVDPGLPEISGTTKDQQFFDDVIVVGSICAGLDCSNGESFGFDTIRLKENNLRIKFQDTSTSASFPSNDWQLTANDTSNGGQNKFSIDDITGGRTPFTIEASAPSHSLYVDDGGRIGIGTMAPVTDIHVKTGNTPTLRLEQDGTSGFTAQTWDLAGNEANFFVRDATNGSKLSFRIYPNAPQDSLTIEGTTGDIGIATDSPTEDLDVRNTGDSAIIRIQGNGGFTGLEIQNTNAAAGTEWSMGHGNGGALGFSHTNTTNAFRVFDNGDIQALGEVFSNTCGPNPANPCAPDYVFEDDYPLLTLDEVAAFIEKEGHLPNVPSAEELVGPISVSKLQMKLLEKIEELTLYTLQQQDTIKSLQAEMAELKEQIQE